MVKHDDYMTPFSAWEDVSAYIPRHLTLWEAFYGDGTSGNHLTELGFDVIHEDVDFFAHDLGECVVTNPPFSELPRVLARLRELGKPFVVIMPCFRAKDAAELQAAIGDAMRTGGYGEDASAPSISVNDEAVMGITWSREDEGSAMQPELVQVPKGATMSQLGSSNGERQRRGGEARHPAQGGRHALSSSECRTKTRFFLPEVLVTLSLGL